MPEQPEQPEQHEVREQREPYWRRSASAPVVAALLAALGAAAVTGCGGAPNAASSTGANATPSGGLAAATGSSFTSAQLRDALISKVDGVRAAAPAEAGSYGTLPDVATSKASTKGVTVNPAKCAQASATGFDSATFADAPASVVTFRIGHDGVSEVLVAADAATADKALQARLPAGCAHYHATVDGKTFGYTVREAAAPGVALQARALNVKAVGYVDVDVWSVVYRGNGFLGAVTIVGPDATEAGAQTLARDAYARAAQNLH